MINTNSPGRNPSESPEPSGERPITSASISLPTGAPKKRGVFFFDPASRLSSPLPCAAAHSAPAFQSRGCAWFLCACASFPALPPGSAVLPAKKLVFAYLWAGRKQRADDWQHWRYISIDIDLDRQAYTNTTSPTYITQDHYLATIEPTLTTPKQTVQTHTTNHPPLTKSHDPHLATHPQTSSLSRPRPS